MAGGMLTKQADQLSARFLNDVNDLVVGGAPVSVPAGAPSAAISATQPGDRIVLDDATAKALSDTGVGTLYGGVYMYVQYKTTTRPAAVGGIAYGKTEIPAQKRATRIVKDVGADEVAREIVEWIKQG